MARIVDQGKLRRRREATATVSMAAGYVDMMRDKCNELLGQTQMEVGGHPLGDQIVADVSRSVEALAKAHGLLLRARESAWNADVTVEVPDPE